MTDGVCESCLCDHCVSERRKRLYELSRSAEEILNSTPKEVWREYRNNGYNLYQAIKEEMSYGDVP